MESIEKMASIYFQENLSGEPLTQDCIEEALVEFTRECINPIFILHKERLNTMKDNLSHWEDENWSVAEILQAQRMINSLAYILSDINKLIS